MNKKYLNNKMRYNYKYTDGFIIKSFKDWQRWSDEQGLIFEKENMNIKILDGSKNFIIIKDLKRIYSNENLLTKKSKE